MQQSLVKFFKKNYKIMQDQSSTCFVPETEYSQKTALL